MQKNVLYFFVIASILFADHTNATSLEEIQSRVFSQVSAIDSIQFIYTFDFVCQKRDKTSQIQGKVEYLQNGRMYFIKTVMYEVGRDGEDETSVTAYDGRRYQVFGTNGRHEKELDYKKTELTDIPSMFPIPLVRLYGWVVAGSPKATRQGLSFSIFSDVKMEDVWENSFKNATLVAATEKGDQQVRFCNSEEDVTVDVTFDVDRGYLPIVSDYITKYDNGKVQVDEVVMKEDSEGIRFYFPIKLTTQSKKNDDDVMSLTYQIDPETLKVNSDIDQELFTIPESWADIVIDVDAAEANQGIIPQPKPYLLVRMCLGVLGMILIAAGIYCKYRNRKTTA